MKIWIEDEDPAAVEEIERAIRAVRPDAEIERIEEDQTTGLPAEAPKKLRIQCFGNFEVFAGNRPVPFARAKAKEIFAYLVDLRGAGANTGELCAVLWEDSTEIERNRHYLRNLISDIRRALRDCGAEDVFLARRNHFSVDVSRLDCDYYRYLAGDPAAISSYRGEYMKQYSWAEFALEHIE